jgi:hypothetical protein
MTGSLVAQVGLAHLVVDAEAHVIRTRTKQWAARCTGWPASNPSNFRIAISVGLVGSLNCRCRQRLTLFRGLTREFGRKVIGENCNWLQISSLEGEMRESLVGSALAAEGALAGAFSWLALRLRLRSFC